jgi:hypothetical protein
MRPGLRFLAACLTGLLSLVMSVPLPEATPLAEAQGCPEVKATAYDDANPLGGTPTIGADQWQGQSFQVSSPIVLSRVSLYLANNGDPNPLTVQLRANDPSVPGGQPGAMLASGSYTSSASAFAFRDFSLGPVPLLANTTYYLVATTPTLTSSNLNYRVARDFPSPTYAGGQYFTTSNQGAPWDTTSQVDLYFQVWAQNCPLPPPTPTNKDQCKDGGYRNFTDPRTGRPFANQGQCVSWTNR